MWMMTTVIQKHNKTVKVQEERIGSLYKHVCGLENREALCVHEFFACTKKEEGERKKKSQTKKNHKHRERDACCSRSEAPINYRIATTASTMHARPEVAIYKKTRPMCETMILLDTARYPNKK